MKESPPQAAQPAKVSVLPFDPAGFNQWLTSLDQGNPAEGVDQIKEGIRLLQGRQQWMAELIRTDPQRALREALSYEQRSSLPDAILRLTEQPLSAATAYEVEIACLLGNGGSKTTRWVTLEDGRQLEAFAFGRRLQVTCKDRISIHGIESAGVTTIETGIVGNGKVIERSYQAVGALRSFGYFHVRRE